MNRSNSRRRFLRSNYRSSESRSRKLLLEQVEQRQLLAVIFSEDFEAPVVSGRVAADFSNWAEPRGRVYAWNEDLGDVSTPDGAQVGAVFLGNPTSYRLETNSITDTLATATTYNLTFNVGNARAGSSPQSTNQYTAELIAGTTVIASTTGQTSTSDMSETGGLSFTTPPGHPNLGETLQVRLYMSGGAWQWNTLFDNIVLDASSTASDTTPPTPDPLQFDLAPRAITESSVYMRAEVASDPNGVQYLFTNTDTAANSGWQSSREWTDTSVTPGNTYNYSVRARDLSANLNETSGSTASAVATEGLILYESFETPIVSGRGPTTDFAGWFETDRVYAWNDDTALITAAADDQVVSLFLGSADGTGRRIETTDITDTLEAGKNYELTFNVGNSNNGNPITGSGAPRYTVDLIAGTTVVASTTGLTATDDLSETGSLTFTAPPGHANLGETLKVRMYHSGGAWQSLILFDNVSLTGTTPVDNDAPIPNPVGFDLPPRAKTESTIYMRAEEVTDPSGVEYLFTNTDTAATSGWQSSREWTDTGLTPGSTYNYTVKARDLSVNLNETATSAASAVATEGLILYESFETPIVSGRGPESDFFDWFETSRVYAWNEDTALIEAAADHQVVSLFLGSADGSGRRIETVNITDTLEAGKNYELNFNVGNSNNGTPQTGSGAPTYTVDLLAGSTVLASTTGLTASDDMSETGSLTFTAPPGHANLGETLKVRMYHSGGAWQSLLLFDNVSFTGVTVVDNDAPNPVDFDLAPRAKTESTIYMRATEVTDPSGVQYLFTNTDTAASSGWQSSREWTDTSLTPGDTYNYTVQARDLSTNLNETAVSAPQSALATPGLIFYDSFENPVLTDGASADFNDWSEPRGRVWARTNSGSVASTTYDHQAASVFIGSPTNYRIESSSITDLLEVKMKYTLSFNVGNVDPGNGLPRSDNQYTAELLAGTTVLATTSGTTTTDDLSETGELEFTTAATHPNEGEPLSIRFYMSGGDWHAHALFDNVSLTAELSNIPPTFTTLTDVVDNSQQDQQVEISFADIAAVGDEADVDGTVTAFVVQAVSSGTLLIGPDAMSATPFVVGSNDTIDSFNNALAYWTPNPGEAGDALNAFTVVALDDFGDLSAGPVQATVAVNGAPVITQSGPLVVSMSQNGSPDAFVAPTIDASDVNSGATLTWTLQPVGGQATNGVASVSGTGASPSITYTPNVDFIGADSFIVQVSDGTLTDSIVVNVNINGPLDLMINEILLNPEDGDQRREYIELKEGPSGSISPNTFLVAIDGTSASAGRINNVFDLSSLSFGAGGFLTLLQADSPYGQIPPTSAVQIANGPGWHHGTTWTGEPNLLNTSTSYLIVRAETAPVAGDNIGTTLPAGWLIGDSVAFIDSDSDRAYGDTVFVNGDHGLTDAGASVLRHDFTPAYLARNGDTSGMDATVDWVSSRVAVAGTAPSYVVDETDVVPSTRSGAPLNHIGDTNFASPIEVSPSDGTNEVMEGVGTDIFDLVVTTSPTADVLVTLDGNDQVELAAGNNAFSRTLILTLQSLGTNPIQIRAVDDALSEGPHSTVIDINTTSDDPRFDGLNLQTDVAIADNDPAVGDLVIEDTIIHAVDGNSMTLSITVANHGTAEVDLNGPTASAGDNVRFEAYTGDNAVHGEPGDVLAFSASLGQSPLPILSTGDTFTATFTFSNLVLDVDERPVLTVAIDSNDVINEGVGEGNNVADFPIVAEPAFAFDTPAGVFSGTPGSTIPVTLTAGAFVGSMVGYQLDFGNSSPELQLDNWATNAFQFPFTLDGALDSGSGDTTVGASAFNAQYPAGTVLGTFDITLPGTPGVYNLSLGQTAGVGGTALTDPNNDPIPLYFFGDIQVNSSNDSTLPTAAVLNPQDASNTTVDLGYVDILLTDAGVNPTGIARGTVDASNVVIAGGDVTVDRVVDLGNGIWRYIYNDDGDTLPDTAPNGDGTPIDVQILDDPTLHPEYTPGQSAEFVVIRDGAGNVIAGQTTTFTYDATSPTVQAVNLNATLPDPADRPLGPQPTSWSQQRSDIREIQIVFSEAIILDPANITLTNLGVNPDDDADTVIDIPANQISVDGNVVTIDVMRDDMGDGVYRLDIEAATDAVGNVMAPYSLSGTTAEPRFYEFQGDWNGDGGVTIFDFNALAYWFGVPGPEYLDLNGDGGISIFDFTPFRQQFTRSVDAPDAPQANLDVIALNTNEFDLAIDVLANDSPLNGLTLVTVSAAQNNPNADVWVDFVNNVIGYESADVEQGWTGTDTFTYVAQDANGVETTGVVNVVVSPVGPRGNLEPSEVDGNEAETLEDLLDDLASDIADRWNAAG